MGNSCHKWTPKKVSSPDIGEVGGRGRVLLGGGMLVQTGKGKTKSHRKELRGRKSEGFRHSYLRSHVKENFFRFGLMCKREDAFSTAQKPRGR